MALIDYVLGILHQDEEGQGLAEYALILALIAIVAIVALIFLGGQVSTILSHRRQLRLAPSTRTPPEAGPSGPGFAIPGSRVAPRRTTERVLRHLTRRRRRT